jgi:hypothetical protein
MNLCMYVCMYVYIKVKWDKVRACLKSFLSAKEKDASPAKSASCGYVCIILELLRKYSSSSSCSKSAQVKQHPVYRLKLR